MSQPGFPIGPDTKVAALLDHYPELEEVLIAMAPPFEKLRNPILRRSVARVASLKQAPAVAGLSVDDVVNSLREAVGQEAIDLSGDSADEPYFGEEPRGSQRVAWSAPSKNASSDPTPSRPTLRCPEA